MKPQRAVKPTQSVKPQQAEDILRRWNERYVHAPDAVLAEFEGHLLLGPADVSVDITRYYVAPPDWPGDEHTDCPNHGVICFDGDPHIRDQIPERIFNHMVALATLLQP